MNPLVEGDRLRRSVSSITVCRASWPSLTTRPCALTCAPRPCSKIALPTTAPTDAATVTASSSAYALATALHIRYHHVGQGEATSAVMPVVTRLTPPEDLEVAARIATALGVWRDGMSAGEAAAATADALDAFYRSIGMPTRVHELDIPQDDLPSYA